LLRQLQLPKNFWPFVENKEQPGLVVVDLKA
jgi:hypothetical protein